MTSVWRLQLGPPESLTGAPAAAAAAPGGCGCRRPGTRAIWVAGGCFVLFRVFCLVFFVKLLFFFFSLLGFSVCLVLLALFVCSCFFCRSASGQLGVWCLGAVSHSPSARTRGSSPGLFVSCSCSQNMGPEFMLLILVQCKGSRATLGMGSGTHTDRMYFMQPVEGHI